MPQGVGYGPQPYQYQEQSRLKREPNTGYAPTLMWPGEQIRPMDQFVESRSTGRSMPPMPAPRMQPPVYEEPEPRSKKMAALGIGLSGLAALGGPAMGARTAENFFEGPRDRAQEDYAREYGAYQENENSWNQYYGRVLQGETLDMQHKQLRETTRGRMATEAQTRMNDERTYQERITRPFSTGRGGLIGREGEVLHEPGLLSSDTQGGRDRAAASQVWADNHSRTVESMEAFEHEEAWGERRQRLGEEVMVVVIKDGRRTRVPRSEAHLYESPADYWDAEGNPLPYPGAPPGEFPGRQRPNVVDQINIAGVERWGATEKRRIAEGAFRGMPGLLKPVPGDPGYDIEMQRLQRLIDQVDVDMEEQKETLRKANISPGGDGRLIYDPATDNFR